MKKLILASGSPRRKELLSLLGLDFEVQVSDVDETVQGSLSPDRLVEELAYKKANAVANSLHDGLVIGSDTIVLLGEDVLGKPSDEQEAALMLSRLQGQTHTVYTGLALIDAESKQIRVSHQSTQVSMRSLSAGQIRSYIATGEPFDKAGSYGIQGVGSTLVQSIVGDFFTVMGLPMALLADLLAEFGIDVLEVAAKKVGSW